MSDVVIRPAGREDMAAAAALRWRWEQERPETPGLAWEDFVSVFVAWTERHESTHRCLLLVRDDVVIGMAWLAIVSRVPAPRAFERACGDLQSVYVVPEERDAGLGGQLVQAVLTLARELGLERVTVHSAERATAAYQRTGFAVSPRLLNIDLTRPIVN